MFKEKKLMKLENELFQSVQYYRLAYDLQNAKDALDINNNNRVIKLDIKFLNDIESNIRSNNAEKLNVELDNIKKELEAFIEKNAKEEYQLLLSDKLDSILEDVFYKDQYDIKKTLFAFKVLLDNEYKYLNNEEALKKVSEIIFKDENKMSEIQEKLSNVYATIANKGISLNQIAIIAGIGLATGAIIGAGIGILSLLAAGGITTSAFVVLDKYNIHKAKKDFAKLSVEETALFLAMKAILIDVAKEKMPTDVFKDNLSEVLNFVEQLKSEVSYLLFVEKEDVASNKDKLKQFHNFDNYMLKTFNI